MACEITQNDHDWCSRVLYFAKEKDDPTRFMGWNVDRCRKLMPTFLAAWEQRTLAVDAFNRIVESYEIEISGAKIV